MNLYNVVALLDDCNFPLASLKQGEITLYAVQDWMRGLSGQENIRILWAMFKKTDAGRQTLTSIERLRYKASDGKTYKRDYAPDKTLCLMAQYMRVNHSLLVDSSIRLVAF